MSAEIIDFTTRYSTPVVGDEPRKPAETLTTTAKNARLRSTRKAEWRKADAATRYWRALLDLNSAVSSAKCYGLKEVEGHPDPDAARLSILDSWREALDRQLLTPAPDMASVSWKRQKLRDSYRNEELIEKAIADDVAFLEGHPTRRDRGNKRVRT